MDKNTILQVNIALTNASLCNAINSYYETMGLPKMPSAISENYKLIIELQLAYKLLLEIMEDFSVVSAFEPFLRQSVDDVITKTKELNPDDTMLRQIKIRKTMSQLADY